MNSNRKKIALLIITVALVILIVIIYFALSQRSKSAAGTANNSQVSSKSNSAPSLPYSLPVSTSSPQTASTTTAPVNYQKPPATHQVTADDLGKIAMAFSERIGSFSNQSGYTNIDGLKIMMTDSMRTWASTYIKQLTDQYQNNGAFYSISTHALLFKVDSFDDSAGTAQMTVTTQRTVRDASLKTQAKPYNQNIKVTFKKVDGNWLVDGAYWQK